MVAPTSAWILCTGMWRTPLPYWIRELSLIYCVRNIICSSHGRHWRQDTSALQCARGGWSRNAAVLRSLPPGRQLEWSSGRVIMLYRRWIHLSNSDGYFRLVTLTGKRWLGTFGSCGVNEWGYPAFLSRRGDAIRCLVGSKYPWCNMSLYLVQRRGC